ncbi:Leucine Rich Repeat domain protein [Aspergillus undulatus]|uniref:Leucine Rich Repeat domain protein n=1 Tax=Aspergillus undulatus TaxID=1810928 RepID=UPI003CCC9036
MPQALRCPDVDALSVYDNRAATYTKLLRFDQALKDARQMIKQDKKDERGYLRGAKALLLDGKPEKALEVYAYALKSLAKDNPRRQVAEQMHAKLHDKLVSKCYDPFNVFPLEIATMVLDHFDFKEIVAILRVSKGWDRFLSSTHHLWLHLDLSRARSKIHWSAVLAYIRRSKAMLTQAIVTNLTKASVPKVLDYISRCPNLQHLEILTPCPHDRIFELFKGCKKLEVLLVSAETTVPQATIIRLLSSLPNLQRIEIHKTTKSTRTSDTNWPSSLPNLKSITLGTTEPEAGANYISALYIPRPIESTPFALSNLTEICLHSNPQIFVPYPPSFNPADFPHLLKLDITGIFVPDHFALPSSLEYLRIRGGASPGPTPFGIAHDEEGTPAPLNLPKLTTLILSDVPWVNHLTLFTFIEIAKAPLDVLHIDGCFRVAAEQANLFPVFHGMVACMLSLSTLNVAHLNAADDSTVAGLIEAMPTLKVLNVSYTPITGVAIKRLADARADEGKASVECVYVKGCEEVSSDAVEYGRSKGLVVIT